MADNNPWLTSDDSAPLVAGAAPSTTNPLASRGRFGLGAASNTNAFEPAASGGWDVPPTASAPASVSASASATRGAAVLDVHASEALSRREAELRRKEEELEKRFSSLRLREAELGITKNWPKGLNWCAFDRMRRPN